VHNPEEGRAAVRDAVRDGADFIKVYHSLSAESYFAVADEAKKLKITFVGHIPDPPGLEACAKAGQKSFEHVFWVGRYLQQVTSADLVDLNETNAKSLITSQTAALSGVFLRNHAWLCPTLTASFGGAGKFSSRDPRLKYLDDRTRAGWAIRLKTLNLAKLRKEHELWLTVVGAMHKAGVGILAGTDIWMDTSTSNYMPYCLPGFGLHDELRHMVSAGLSPMDALRTATYNPAKFLGLLDSLGTAETGKLAELVLLDANPLDNIANTSKIDTVFTGGRVYRRPALDAMLDAVETNVRNAFRLDPTVLSRYVGDYEETNGSVKLLWTVTLEEGVLWMGQPNGSKIPITPISETTFTGFAEGVEFVKNDKGVVTQLRIIDVRADRKN
jgi:imidazolonepropionase-like amidohydrolase